MTEDQMLCFSCGFYTMGNCHMHLKVFTSRRTCPEYDARTIREIINEARNPSTASPLNTPDTQLDLAAAIKEELEK